MVQKEYMRVYEKKKVIYAVYDLEDEIIEVFDTGKEVAEWLGVKARVFYSAFTRINNGEREKIKNKNNGNFYKIYKYLMEEE